MEVTSVNKVISNTYNLTNTQMWWFCFSLCRFGCTFAWNYRAIHAQLKRFTNHARLCLTFQTLVNRYWSTSSLHVMEQICNLNSLSVWTNRLILCTPARIENFERIFSSEFKSTTVLVLGGNHNCTKTPASTGTHFYQQC